MNAALFPFLTAHLSLSRENGHGCAAALEGSPFYLSGLHVSAKFDDLAALDLAKFLRIAYPHPNAIIVGGAYSKAEQDRVVEVWQEYADETGVRDGEVVRLTQQIIKTESPEGIGAWVRKELEKGFEVEETK